MNRARQLQSLFMTMQISKLSSDDLVKSLRVIFEVEDGEDDSSLVMVIKQTQDVYQQAEAINEDLHKLSNAISSLRFNL